MSAALLAGLAGMIEVAGGSWRLHQRRAEPIGPPPCTGEPTIAERAPGR
jgi:hypothetical protein